MEQVKLNHTEPVNKDVDIKLPLTPERMKELQQSNRHIKHLVKQWDKNDLDKKVYTMENGLLKRKLIINGLQYKPVVVPDILRDCLLILAYNEAGHNGSKRTCNALRNLFYWKGMKKSVHKHCTNCQTYAKHNVKVQQMKNEHFSAPPQPMEFITMDLIGGFHLASSKGNRCALTDICMLTDFTFCIPIKSKCTEEIVKAYLNHICCVFCPSRKILTDNGTEFRNKLWTESAQSAPFFLMFGREAAVKHTLLAPESLKYLGSEEGILDIELMKKLFHVVAFNLDKARRARDAK